MTKKVDFNKMSTEELKKYGNEHLEGMTLAEKRRYFDALEDRGFLVSDDSAIFNLDKDRGIVYR